jgi:hypothetical protein
MFKGALSGIAQFTAPLRRFGASSVARIIVLALGLSAMTVFTVPDLKRAADIWLTACLWCCLAYFAVECAIRARTAIGVGEFKKYAFSPSGIVDLVGVFAVPIALLCGVTPNTSSPRLPCICSSATSSRPRSVHCRPHYGGPSSR